MHVRSLGVATAIPRTKREDGSWRDRIKAALEELVAQSNISETKAHRLRWLDRLEKMGDDRNAKSRSSGRRSVNR